jgi:hypothetical protein
VEKYKDFSKDDMIGLEGALFKRWKLEGNEGSEARSKGNEVKARRRTQKKVGLGNALPQE